MPSFHWENAMGVPKAVVQLPAAQTRNAVYVMLYAKHSLTASEKQDARGPGEGNLYGDITAERNGRAILRRKPSLLSRDHCNCAFSFHRPPHEKPAGGKRA